MGENIYLFVPNLIDYGRIVLAFISFYFMPTDPYKAGVCYFVSAFLDAFDGHFARKLNQASRFGAMLDQLTDRFTTMGLCAVLCHLYPRYMFFFLVAMTVDIVSHWMHLQASALKGSDSHKKIDLSANPVLRHYYGNKVILFTMCAANEAFYCAIYMCYFTPGPAIPVLGVGLFKAAAVFCCPLSLLKSFISILQLLAASENFVMIDREERKASKKSAKAE